MPLAVYVPAEIMQKLRKLAQEDRRTISSLALVLIEKGLKTKDR
ncbi:MAG: hypothetical protein ACHQ2Y_00950 [Candidatus Lutacidiplasmatales archaeon]